MRNSLLKHILVLFSVLLTIGVSGCRDDIEFGTGGISDETSMMQLTLDFAPMSEGLTRTPVEGDAIAGIQDLCLVLFETNGKYHSMIEVPMADVTITSVERHPGDAAYGIMAGETTTARAQFKYQLPIGTYYLYALANFHRYNGETCTETTAEYVRNIIDELNADPANPATLRKFCEYRREWNVNDIRENSGLTGFLTEADKDGSSKSPETIVTEENGQIKLPGSPVTIKRSMNSLHGWLRRMASKVTVTFDARDMLDNVSVYIHDVRIIDAVKDAPLLTAGKASAEKDLLNRENPDVRKHNYLPFCPEGDMDLDIDLWKDRKEAWPMLSKNNWTFGPSDGKNDYYTHPQLENLTHSNNAWSLFFYENMQGEGESKLQDAVGPDGEIPDGIIDSPNSGIPGEDHYKDNKPYGTYVEVKGYYVCTIPGKQTQGPITYRFMLGKDTKKNYDCERNFHYKLTLVLKGMANEADWHIDYKSIEDEVDIPSPYYISYGYNESLELPIKVRGEVESVRATIIRNDWYPSVMWVDKVAPEWENQSKSADNTAFTGNITNPVLPSGTEVSDKTAMGFLTLLQLPKGKEDAFIPENVNIKELVTYWTKPRDNQFQYTREYKLSGNQTSVVDEDKSIGSWRYEKSGDYTHMYVKLYTRERNLIKAYGFTGQNPFVANQRRAKVRFDITMKGGRKLEPRIIDIIQVVRAGNPTGIWRSWNNSRPFHVALNLIDGDDNDTYHTLESRGGWSAEVIKGAEWILLNGGRQKIYGPRGSTIEFDTRPVGPLSSPKQTRFGIIEIRYHDYSCVHKIFVRQGYEPIQINEGGTYWHTFNMETKSKEGVSPMDEGSMFRFGKWDFPIASSNNYNDKTPWINVIPSDFKSHTGAFTIAGDENNPKTWDDIGSLSSDKPFMASNSIKVGNAACRMMELKDIQALRDNADNAYAYGILYGDEASGSLFNVNEVYGYKGYLSHQQYGMRGCFVYNKNTGAQIFFPIGSSGFGCRQHEKNIALGAGTGAAGESTESRKAILKYAGNATKYYIGYPQSGYSKMPLFFTLFKSQGAIYWTYKKETKVKPGHEDSDTDAIGLDLNYFTYDFNPIAAANVFTSGTNSYACFIRLVQDSKP